MAASGLSQRLPAIFTIWKILPRILCAERTNGQNSCRANAEHFLDDPGDRLEKPDDQNRQHGNRGQDKQARDKQMCDREYSAYARATDGPCTQVSRLLGD